MAAPTTEIAIVPCPKGSDYDSLLATHKEHKGFICGYVGVGFTVKAINGPVGAGSEKGESVCGGYWVGELGAASGVHGGRGCGGSFWEDGGAGREGGAVAC